jgi:anthranilate synthase component 2
MQHVLLLDNKDSFTYNLVQLLHECGIEHQLVIHNCTDDPTLITSPFDFLILSPGPGLPVESGFLMQWIERYSNIKPTLGVCLGHQALAQHFGAGLRQLAHSAHGQSSTVKVDVGSKLFAGLPEFVRCGRYHSWVIDHERLPPELMVIATDEDSNIMAFAHKQLPVYGVQFHPESYMTEHGMQMMRNFLLLG